MSTPSERERATEQVVVQDTETVETAVVPPSTHRSLRPCHRLRSRATPPASRSSSKRSAAAHYATTATGERVLVEDPGGTRVVTTGVRTPLPPDEDPRRWNWLTPALVFILLAALGIVLAAVVLSRDDDKKTEPERDAADEHRHDDGAVEPDAAAGERLGARCRAWSVSRAATPSAH